MSDNGKDGKEETPAAEEKPVVKDDSIINIKVRDQVTLARPWLENPNPHQRRTGQTGADLGTDLSRIGTASRMVSYTSAVACCHLSALSWRCGERSAVPWAGEGRRACVQHPQRGRGIQIASLELPAHELPAWRYGVATGPCWCL